MPVITHNIGSSLIETAGYDQQKKEMVVKFKTGGTYIYSQIPRDLFNAFLDAESPGKFFHSNIRHKFDARKKKEV